MPSFEWTIRIGDILMAVVVVGIIPLSKLLVRVLLDLRDAVHGLSFVVLGSKDRPGLVGDVSELRKESTRHRNWLIELQAERGMTRDDRS